MKDKNQKDYVQDKKLDSAFKSLHSGDYTTALKYFESLARDGSLLALTNIGWMYDNGVGVVRDQDKAKECYKIAAEADHTTAKHYLARVLHRDSDFSEAFFWFDQAAREGHLPAKYWLATMYLHGEGVKQSYEIAESLLTEAFNRGHIFAKRDLCLYTIKGHFTNHKSIICSYIGYVGAVIQGTKLAIKDPESHLIQ